MIELEEFEDGNPVNKEREKFNRRNEAILYHNDDVGIVFIGDSITAYWDIDSYFRHKDNKRLINRGVSDDYTMYCRRRFEADALQLKPDLIILSIGVNNTKTLSEATDDTDARPIIDQAVNDIKAMIVLSREHHIPIAVTSVTSLNRPHLDQSGVRAAAITEINSQIERLADDMAIPFINYYKEMTINNRLNAELTKDGLHPHVKGYDVMAAVLSRQIEVLTTK
ncbi:hypothetical protein ERX37_01105 [Macrococcus hajekii]|uniref:SGNH hydrolase-type esterase domain-containing protein n=1 Tax=Macrococcus hajekii TaxID=198482 RepID=A0A4R6BM46_9STAP|nr:GDSL-type esterase/lipase family protein [Macrococcus hajekii]TDM02717.1 hypothetical protein ERX37_01105 [Macrococcus hajekii]GGB03306.1 lipase [Macrococcus hajekii]